MAVTNIPGRTSTAQHQLLFQATLPPLGLNTYYFQSKNELPTHVRQTTARERTENNVKITLNENCTLKNSVCILE